MKTAVPSQNASMTPVDVRGLMRTDENSATVDKRRAVNRLGPEVERHHRVTRNPPFQFDSRRLHHIPLRLQGVSSSGSRRLQHFSKNSAAVQQGDRRIKTARPLAPG